MSEARMAAALGNLLAEVQTIPLESNPFAGSTPSEEFLSAAPEKPPETMETIVALRSKIRVAISQSDVVTMGKAAGALREFLGSLPFKLL